MTMNCGFLVFVIAAFISTTSAKEVSSEKIVSVTADLSDAGQLTARAINLFAWDVFQHFSQSDENIFISPFSISTALTLTWAGAAGDTSNEMARVLRYTASSDLVHNGYRDLLNSLKQTSHVDLSVANALFPANKFKFRNDYIALMRSCYMAEATELDYAGEPEKARLHINHWVGRETREKISNLIAPGILDASTVMVLVNAIYFKGNWNSQFNPENTRPGPFLSSGGEQRTPLMMHQKNQFRYMQSEEMQLLEMPYAGDRLAMILILPRPDYSLKNLQLDMNSLAEHFDQMSEQTVSVTIPKLKLDWGATDISPILQSMGMKTMFSPAADFSQMSSMKSLYVSMVLHKTTIEIDETGSEAAGATAVVMRKTSIPRENEFVVNRPFVFLIRDRLTGILLFIGRVMDIPS